MLCGAPSPRCRAAEDPVYNHHDRRAYKWGSQLRPRYVPPPLVEPLSNSESHISTLDPRTRPAFVLIFSYQTSVGPRAGAPRLHRRAARDGPRDEPHRGALGVLRAVPRTAHGVVPGVAEELCGARRAHAPRSRGRRADGVRVVVVGARRAGVSSFLSSSRLDSLGLTVIVVVVVIVIRSLAGALQLLRAC